MLDTLETTITKPKKVTIIPATKSLHPERDGVEPLHKKRVAAYCRVSTTQEEQQGSYDLQQRYYESLIANNPNWEPAGVYGDEGKSGTTLRGRTGFLQMMDDVRAGKIDYIITKATSRFGRNNAEFIEILDELESYGVEVLFESEGIVTSGQQNRTMLQMLGISNEHYSSCLSNNIRWSQERNMRKGEVHFCYKHFLGYEKGKDGKPTIVEKEAKTIRSIYQLFLDGKTYSYIASYLTERNIPTPTGKGKWSSSTVKSILTNEKYAGDAILQKTFRRSYLDKSAHINTGEKPQIYVENDHPPIIDKATFTRAQELVKTRCQSRNSGTKKSPFSGKLICADCGEYFGHKTWVSRGRIKYTMWICNHKYSEETAYSDNKCKSANLRQEWVEQGYLYTMNQLLSARSEMLAKYERRLARVNHRLESGAIEKELKKLEEQDQELNKRIATLIGEREFSFGEQSELQNKEDALEHEGKEILEKTKTLETERQELNNEKKLLETFIQAFKAMPEVLTKFKAKDFTDTIDHVEVRQTSLLYEFYGGEGITVTTNLLRKLCLKEG